jgi:hypothetical protein
VTHAGLLVATIGLGLASRRWGSVLPDFVATYAGDTLWAMAAYWTLALVAPRVGGWRRGLLALGISLAVEVSQLFHPPWLDALRRTRLGGLLLGFGFLWSDLACYAAGVALALAIDRLLAAREGRPRLTPT